MKDFLKKLLDEHASKILPFTIGLFSMFLIFSFFDFWETEKQEIKDDEVINELSIPMSTEKSKNFLNCIYEQLECYNKNAGSEREIILKICKDINYCDRGK
jgi:hypothetical protein